MNWDDPRIKVAVIAMVVIISGWMLLTWLMPGPEVRKGDGIGLNVRSDEAGDTDRTSSLLILDNIQFDLDKYEPIDAVEAERLAAMKRSRTNQAAALEAFEFMNDFESDLNGELGRMFNKSMFYESKGEYEKSIRLLVAMTRKDFRSPVFKAKVWLKLAQMYGIMGVEKQHWKAMLRYFELQEEHCTIPELKTDYRKKRLYADQKVALLGGGGD